MTAKNDAQTTATTPDPMAQRHRRERLNVSRPALAELTGLSLSRVWAAEQPGKVVTDEHRALLVAALDNIEKNGLPEHLRPRERAARADSKQELLDRLQSIADVLAGTTDMKSLKDVREAIEVARRTATGEVMEAVAEAAPAE